MEGQPSRSRSCRQDRYQGEKGDRPALHSNSNFREMKPGSYARNHRIKSGGCRCREYICYFTDNFCTTQVFECLQVSSLILKRHNLSCSLLLNCIFTYQFLFPRPPKLVKMFWLCANFHQGFFSSLVKSGSQPFQRTSTAVRMSPIKTVLIPNRNYEYLSFSFFSFSLT